MTDYLAWNNAIGARFFNPDKAGTRVFLYVTTDVINQIGAASNSNLDDFTSAVKIGPPWVTRHGLCQQALQALENWRTRECVYPPYLGCLAFFVLAGTVDVGFARHAYYPGLRHLLGEEVRPGGYPSFDQMHFLWDDLAVWSNQDKHGEWGIFDADIVGEWINVGIPKAQTLLTDEERENLPLLFAENGFDPHSLPSDQELASLLADDPFHRLRPHTKALLRSTGDNDTPIRAALVETILDELQNWDGSAPARPELGEQSRSSMGSLRLVMVLDQTARTTRIGLRCRSNREYPEEGLQLSGAGIPGSLYCFEDWQGWSTPFSDDETQTRMFDAASLDWSNGISLADQEHSWRTALSKRQVRVMISAAPFGFDGFVEDSQMPKGKSFYLLARDTTSDVLQRWGAHSCDGFIQMNTLSGLPVGWRLYFVERANSDDIIRNAFPFLAFPATLRIQFRGGLKVQGNQYFTFALPCIEVAGADQSIGIFCNGHPLSRNQSTDLHEIPDGLCGCRLLIEVRRQDECVCRRSIYTLEAVEWLDIAATTRVDRFGLQTAGNSAEHSVGPLVYGYEPPRFNPEIFLPPSKGSRVFFIGRNPGEIAVSPGEPIPRDWAPVWAIPMRDRGHAIFCGTDPAASTPTMIAKGDKRRVKKWKEILWYNRRRIEPPQHPAIGRLWRAFKEIAERVR